MIKRIIHKQTGYFIRDDFKYDEETEIALDVEPSQGFYHPRWDGVKWVEGATVIPQPQPQKLSLEDRVVTLEETLEVLFK